MQCLPVRLKMNWNILFLLTLLVTTALVTAELEEFESQQHHSEILAPTHHLEENQTTSENEFEGMSDVEMVQKSDAKGDNKNLNATKVMEMRKVPDSKGKTSPKNAKNKINEQPKKQGSKNTLISNATPSGSVPINKKAQQTVKNKNLRFEDKKQANTKVIDVKPSENKTELLNMKDNVAKAAVKTATNISSPKEKVSSIISNAPRKNSAEKNQNKNAKATPK
ncbi:hypothetical protein B566_EDAN002236 [Ephemera danica]|nr:hypothetical protein B566_EDAN002236 [Ephemera danica]